MKFEKKQKTKKAGNTVYKTQKQTSFDRRMDATKTNDDVFDLYVKIRSKPGEEMCISGHYHLIFSAKNSTIDTAKECPQTAGQNA